MRTSCVIPSIPQEVCKFFSMTNYLQEATSSSNAKMSQLPVHISWPFKSSFSVVYLRNY